MRLSQLYILKVARKIHEQANNLRWILGNIEPNEDWRTMEYYGMYVLSKRNRLQNVEFW